MQILIVIVLVFMVTFAIFGAVDMIRQVNNLPDTTDKK